MVYFFFIFNEMSIANMCAKQSPFKLFAVFSVLAPTYIEIYPCDIHFVDLLNFDGNAEILLSCFFIILPQSQSLTHDKFFV